MNYVYSLRPDMNLRLGYSTTVNRPEFRELAAFEFTDVVGSRAVRGNPDLDRALIQNVDARWELFSDGRDVVAASAFYKCFDSRSSAWSSPAPSRSSRSRTPTGPATSASSSRPARKIGEHVFVNANYTYVDSTITLLARAADGTDVARAAAGRPVEEPVQPDRRVHVGGFSARLLYNFFDDRISDVGSNEAPDIVEQGRGQLDLVLIQRFGKLNVRLGAENLADSDYRFTQGAEDQRLFKLGRTFTLSFGFASF